MPGRHVPSPALSVTTSARRSSARAAGIGATAVAVIVAVCVALLAGRGSGLVRSAARCNNPITLQVLASPAIATSIDTIAAHWATGAASEPGCLHVTTVAMADVAAEARLAGGADDTSSVWIPDSSVWAHHLSADVTGTGSSPLTVQIGPSAASSPIVEVTRPEASTTDVVARTAAGPSSPRTPIAVPDPLSNAEGLLGLQLLTSKAQDLEHQIGSMVQLGRSTIDTPLTGFAKLRAGVPFVASEQAVIAHNLAAGRVDATATYPARALPALDFPVVQLQRPGTNPRLLALSASLGRALVTVIAQRVLADSGFRDPAGDPISGMPGASGRAIQVLPAITAEQASSTLRMWSAATEDSHTLAVIDVSGSMADPAGNGQSKIQVAAAAAANAAGYFPDSSAFGLWAFSSDQAGGLPWRELARPLPLGSPGQRKALAAAAAKLPSLVGGDTALYDTALAAFEAVRNTYDPSKVNAVVLLTDGMNQYPAGISLDQLLTSLRALTDPARPVPIITIGVGTDADIATLRQISAVTGGKTYAVLNPAAIQGVFLDAMLQRECRPSCSGS